MGFSVQQGIEDRLTGPITLKSVNSNTFSMEDLAESRGGGLTRVERFAAIREKDFGGGERVCDRWKTAAQMRVARWLWIRGRGIEYCRLDLDSRMRCFMSLFLFLLSSHHAFSCRRDVERRTASARRERENHGMLRV